MTEGTKPEHVFHSGDVVKIKSSFFTDGMRYKLTDGTWFAPPDELVKKMLELGPYLTIDSYYDNNFNMGGRYTIVGGGTWVLGGNMLEQAMHMNKAKIDDCDMYNLLNDK